MDLIELLELNNQSQQGSIKVVVQVILTANAMEDSIVHLEASIEKPCKCVSEEKPFGLSLPAKYYRISGFIDELNIWRFV